MKISIITVVYNNHKTIETAIQSVLGQRYANVEYIIIDGQSTDGTLDLIHRYGHSISKVISEPDLGIYDAMNKGIQQCTGEVIGILNSDDVYADDHVLSAVMHAFGEDQELDLLYGDLVYVKNNDLNQVVRKWTSKSYYPRFFEDGHVPPHPSLFIKKAVYDQVGLFNLEMRLAADYEFMLRLFKLHPYKSKYLNRLFVKMRLGGATNASIKNIINGNLEILRAWKINHLKAPFLLMPKRIAKRLIQFAK
ncbi:glycosyltransferase family 2 protein [Pedobacter sp. CFBP9032]|uniref:glycosyltransferase family 2 protein n=1 Tax=Pedobacter sp. CFBP9032 TaxID=3096539 RepID=UPI002A6B62C0|nr:glycosyltransferase family 2 protein [Pedobacter sp. CFBP9032]MDY0907190.1 glycosyltransferase family 2 protein [Pedobacter sp. CFBP9032]